MVELTQGTAGRTLQSPGKDVAVAAMHHSSKIRGEKKEKVGNRQHIFWTEEKNIARINHIILPYV